MATFRKISWKIGGDFLIRIAKLLEQGLSLEMAISFLSITLPKEKNRFHFIISELRSGSEFALSLKKAAFPDFICAQIFYANRHGYFITTLRETGQHMQRKHEENKKLKKTFQYPFILCITLAIIFILLRLFLLPKFDLLFKQLQQSNNEKQTFLFILLEKFPVVLGMIGLIIIAAISIFLIRQKNKTYLAKINTFVQIPVVKNFIKAQHSQIFAREIGYLSKCGLSIQDILQVFTEKHSPPFLLEISHSLKQQLDSGIPLHQICKNYLFFEKELIYIIHHGENNGKLAEELLFYYKDSQTTNIQRLERLFSYIQPIVFLIIGTSIVITYLAILFPMFRLMDQL